MICKSRLTDRKGLTMSKEEIITDATKLIPFLMSFIDFMWTDMEEIYTKLGYYCEKYKDIVDELCGDGK